MASESLVTLARRSRRAAQRLASSSLEARNGALDAIRDELVSRREAILEANRADKEASSKAGISESLFKVGGGCDTRVGVVFVACEPSVRASSCASVSGRC